MSNEPLLKLELPGVKKLKSGKVREVFDLGEHLLIVATDRISAFDCVMPNGIPRKGEVLTQISYFWFEQTERLAPNHLVSKAGDPVPAALRTFSTQLARRSMVVRKAQPLAIECVVRGYLSGSGWKDYQKSGAVCGLRLPAGLRAVRAPGRTSIHPRHQGRKRPRRKHLLRPRLRDHRARAGREGAGAEFEDLSLRRQLRLATGDHHRGHQVRVWPGGGETDVD